MSQQVQELINKIKNEGIEEAKKKAAAVDAQAKKDAEEVIAKARQEADKLIADSKVEIDKMKEAAEHALRQAARDTLLDLRKEIEGILKKIVLSSVGQALTTEELSCIISNIIEKSFDKKTADANIKVILNASDLEHLKKGFIGKLQAKLKEGIHFERSEDISKAFMISFDGGNSAFEVNDTALAEYLTTYLNPEIAALIKDKRTH